MSQMQSMESAKGLPALRAKPEPNEAGLRRELASAIDGRRAADARVKIAADAERRASAALHEASAALSQIEANRQRASDADTKKRAKAAADAIRAGSPIPVVAPMPEADWSSLATARAQESALRAALAELVSEHDVAKAEVTTTAATVTAKANAVADCVGKRLIEELRAARDVLWRLEEIASGFSSTMPAAQAARNSKP